MESLSNGIVKHVICRPSLRTSLSSIISIGSLFPRRNEPYTGHTRHVYVLVINRAHHQFGVSHTPIPSTESSPMGPLDMSYAILRGARRRVACCVGSLFPRRNEPYTGHTLQVYVRVINREHQQFGVSHTPIPSTESYPMGPPDMRYAILHCKHRRVA